MIKLKLISSLLLLLSFNLCFSQNSVKGVVTDNDNLPVPFANVVMYNTLDSTTFKYGGITDLNGNYEIKNVAADNYCLVVSFIGYRNIKDTIAVNGTSPILLNYKMEADIKMLNAASVQESRARTLPDKTTYSILPKDIKSSRNALDLTTIVPQIIFDPVNEKISGTNGKPVKILINGLNATEIELKSLRPDQIIRLDHYDVPPARYAEYGNVINIITKSAEDGFAAGINASSAFTTGFGNEMAYFKFNRKQQQFAIDYSLYYRNYSDREQESFYNYNFNGTEYTRTQKLKNAFGYDDHYINFTYTNQKTDNYALKIKLSPNYMGRKNDGNSVIDYDANGELSQRTGNDHTKASVFSPSADIYFWKQMNNKQELAVNIVGTGFLTSNKYYKKEYDSSHNLVLDDNMDEKNRKQSLIGEVNYSVELKKMRLNAGYSVETSSMKSDVVNSFESSIYTTSLLKNYLYSEISGQKDKWSYKASIGVSNIKRETVSDKYSNWLFRPSLTVGYNINKNQNLRLSYKKDSAEPSLSELSNNRIFITEHIIRQGNPDLRPSVSNELFLDYSLKTKLFDFQFTPYYRQTTNPINTYFTRSGENIVMASENGEYSETYGMSYSGTIKPFSSNLVTIRFNGQVMNTELRSAQAGSYSHLYTPLWYQINVQHKNILVYYQGNIVGKYLNGPYLSTNENNSHFGARYTRNNLSVFASIYWIFTRSKYRTSTIPESIVNFHNFSWINDNASMFVLGISYNLVKGKSYSEKARKLQNADRDSGMF